jgi:hypothetical protein
MKMPFLKILTPEEARALGIDDVLVITPLSHNQLESIKNSKAANKDYGVPGSTTLSPQASKPKSQDSDTEG